MIENINNFDNKYNIKINLLNDILYIDVYNILLDTQFNIIISSIDLLKKQINNINHLYICLKKCLYKQTNYNINIYENSLEMIIAIDYVDENYIQKHFELFLLHYDEYYEKIINEYCETESLNKQNKILNNEDYFSNIYKYVNNIIDDLLKICCIDD